MAFSPTPTADLLAGLVSTDDVISEAALRDLFTMDADEALDAGPHQVCAGAWAAEPGEPRTWRFWHDPDQDDEGEAELADETPFAPRPDLDL